MSWCVSCAPSVLSHPRDFLSRIVFWVPLKSRRQEGLTSLHRYPLRSFMLKATSINLGLRVLLAFVSTKCCTVSPPEPQEKYKLTSFGICNNNNRLERLPLLIITLSCLRGLWSRRKPHNLIISELSQQPQRLQSKNVCAGWILESMELFGVEFMILNLEFDVIIYPSVS